MENKQIGWMLLGISALMIVIILLFNSAMMKIIEEGCTIDHLKSSCPAYQTISQQTYLSLAIVGMVVLLGIYFIFSKPRVRIIVKQQKAPKIKIDMSQFNAEEKSVIKILSENKAMFQADLSEKIGFSKVKLTRVLDKLEAKGIIERKRRGMNNLVVISGN